MGEKPRYTVQELAQKLKVARTTIYYMVDKLHITMQVEGHKAYISAEDAERIRQTKGKSQQSEEEAKEEA